MRFGLAGTGYWARVTHAAVLAREPGVDFAAVWGRDGEKAAVLGEEVGADAHTDFTEFLSCVDAVAFAVPPDVQAELGTRAGAAGKHLLLDKPLATSVADAQRLVEAVDRAGVSTVVFFTGRFAETNRQWLATVDGGAWKGAGRAGSCRPSLPAALMPPPSGDGRRALCGTLVSRLVHAGGRPRPRRSCDR